MPNKPKYYNRYFVGFVLLSLMFSCKEDDEIIIRPEIEIISPAKYSEFNPNDTILVEFSVASESNNLDASIQVFNTDHTPVFDSKIIENIQANQIVSCYYLLGELQQSETLFDLTITVSQEESYSSSESCPIYINPTTEVLNSIWIVTETQSVFLSIHVLEPDFTHRNTLNYHGNFAGSDMNSQGKQFVIAGSNFGDLTAYNTETFNVEWKVPIISNPVQPYFTDVKAHNNLFYVSFWDGQTIGYNQQGMESYQAQGLGTVVPQDLHFNSNKIFITGFQRSNVAQNWWMANYANGGTLLYSDPIDFEPVGFTNLEASNTLIFANDNDGKLITKVHSHYNNLFTEPYEPFVLPDEKVNCSCTLTVHHSLLATENGIYKYIYQQMIYKISNIHNVSTIAYDEINELIWAASENTLYVMTMTGEIVGEYTAEKEILNFHLLYNK